MNFSIVEQYVPVLTKPKVFFLVPNFAKDAPKLHPLRINLALARLRTACCAGKNRNCIMWTGHWRSNSSWLHSDNTILNLNRWLDVIERTIRCNSGLCPDKIRNFHWTWVPSDNSGRCPCPSTKHSWSSARKKQPTGIWSSSPSWTEAFPSLSADHAVTWWW